MKQWKSALARGGSSETNMEKLREKINKKSYVE